VADWRGFQRFGVPVPFPIQASAGLLLTSSAGDGLTSAPRTRWLANGRRASQAFGNASPRTALRRNPIKPGAPSNSPAEPVKLGH
jgi:hypothetical protein